MSLRELLILRLLEAQKTLKITSNADFVTDIVESKTSVHKDHDQHSDKHWQECVLSLLVRLVLVLLKHIGKHLSRNTRTMSAISEQQLLKFTKFRTTNICTQITSLRCTLRLCVTPTSLTLIPRTP